MKWLMKSHQKGQEFTIRLIQYQQKSCKVIQLVIFTKFMYHNSYKSFAISITLDNPQLASLYLDSQTQLWIICPFYSVLSHSKMFSVEDSTYAINVVCMYE